MTAVLERPRAAPEALIEEARSRQRQRRALFGFVALLLGAVLALPVVAGDGSGGGAERFAARFGPMGQRSTTTPGPPLHTATSVLFVGERFIDVDPRAGNTNHEHGVKRLLATFRAMLESRPIVRAAIRRAGVHRTVETVLNAVDANTPTRTSVIEVSVIDRRVETARNLVDSIAETFVDQINGFEPPGTPTDHLVSVYERAREGS